MDLKQKYQDKLMKVEDAVALIKSGDWVDYGWTATTPKIFDEALTNHLKSLSDVKFRGGILMHEPLFFQMEDAKKHFTWNSWHFGGIERKAISKGISFYGGFRYSELPRYYYDNEEKSSVAYLMVSPMDDFGYFNFGPSTSHLRAVVENANKVIVEINPKMPICYGSNDAYVHIDEIFGIVEGKGEELDVMASNFEASEVDNKVAEYVVKELKDGSCLQLGIGAMPNAIGKVIAKSDLKDLGVHTEMYVDAFLELDKAGKITGKYKNINKGLQTYTFAAGSKELYDYLNHNPSCYAAASSYINSADTISKLDNFISINNAIDIDLFGQISAESSGYNHISGAGGQLDFVLGAYKSNGGKSFMCLSSTFKDKKTGEVKSRIRPTLSPGSIVTDTRANAMYIVTEYGIANMKGKTTWQRAKALIDIAHPDFREELINEAIKMHIYKD